MAGARQQMKLTIQRDLTASWTMCNSEFTADTMNHWTGVLFQLGDFRGPKDKGVPYRLGPVTLQLESGETRTYKRNEFTWINIVSDWAGHSEPAISETVFALYPNGKVFPGDPCKDLTVSARCLRARKLHWNQETVAAIITYWSGVNGFELSATRTDSYWPSSRLEFTLGDDVKVAVYKADGPPTDPQMTLLKDFAMNEVVSIFVAADTEGPTDGDKQDPPWPITDD